MQEALKISSHVVASVDRASQSVHIDDKLSRLKR
jgi:hypothetical protein